MKTLLSTFIPGTLPPFLRVKCNSAANSYLSQIPSGFLAFGALAATLTFLVLMKRSVAEKDAQVAAE